jgi:hypothetical protein
VRNWAVGAALAVAGLAATPAAGGAGLLAAARLQGVFAMTGVITDAVNAGSEHPGELVRRTWTFTSTCPAGACPTVVLLRTRNRTLPLLTDQLVLRRRSPGVYAGTATFLAPVRCAGRRYAKGDAVPFSIAVRVTAARAVGTQVLATGVRAFYRNPRRIGLTKCVSAPAHDAARYTGTLVVAPDGATRSEPSTRSSTVS